MRALRRGTYYGNMKAESQMNGILFSEYDYHAPRTPWHYHENPYFMYVIEGDLLDVNQKGKTICPPGSFLLHNWQEPHYNTKESRHARGFHIEFERSWFEQNNVNVDLWEGSQLIKNPRLHHVLARLLAEFRYNDAYSEVSCELLLSELCDNLEKEKDYHFEAKPAWLSSLVELVHYGKETFTPKSLSDELGIHPGHLSRAMPQYFSTTLGDYMRQVKVKKAIHLMLTSPKSLIDITFECGFSDQSHFGRTFKSYMGMSPKVFCKKHGQC